MKKINDILKEQEKERKEDTSTLLPTSKLTNLIVAILFGDNDVSGTDTYGELFCSCKSLGKGFTIRIWNKKISATYRLLQPELFGEMEIDKVYNLENSIRKEVRNSNMWFELMLTSMPFYSRRDELVEPISLNRNGKIVRKGYERIKEEE